MGKRHARKQNCAAKRGEHSDNYTEEVSFPRTSAICAGVLLLTCFYFGYLFHISGVGLLGPDEPRYASIGREMAESGDWITPRLWAEPWFEKPPLLYWLTGLGFLLGLPVDSAPRAGIAVLSGGFLILFWRCLRRRSGTRAAWLSTLILGSSAGWIAFSQVCATDLPLAATFAAGMLLTFEGLEENRRGPLLGGGVAFGLSVLAKGMVGLVLALPLLWFAWRRWREFVVPVLLGLAVAAPWYALMGARHGRAFFDEFFLKHHLARFSDAAVAHAQPWWYYAPVLVCGLFPWFPLLTLVRRSTVESHFGKLLAVWLLWGIVFFSAATNKLPGYLLPLLPAAAGLLGIALERVKNAAIPLAVSTLLLASISVIAGILPQALLEGLTNSHPGEIRLDVVAGVGLAAVAVWWLTRRVSRTTATGLVAGLSILGVAYLKLSVYPALDRDVSARSLWIEHAMHLRDACLGDLPRDDRYGMNYYTRSPLPDCASDPRPVSINRRR